MFHFPLDRSITNRLIHSLHANRRVMEYLSLPGSSCFHLSPSLLHHFSVLPTFVRCTPQKQKVWRPLPQPPVSPGARQSHSVRRTGPDPRQPGHTCHRTVLSFPRSRAVCCYRYVGTLGSHASALDSSIYAQCTNHPKAYPLLNITWTASSGGLEGYLCTAPCRSIYRATPSHPPANPCRSCCHTTRPASADR